MGGWSCLLDMVVASIYPTAVKSYHSQGSDVKIRKPYTKPPHHFNSRLAPPKLFSSMFYEGGIDFMTQGILKTGQIRNC